MKIQGNPTLRWHAQFWNLAIAGLLLFLLLATLVRSAAAAPLSTFTPPTSVTVTMYELNSDGSIKNNTLCVVDPPDTNFGCTWTSASPYPYTINPATVPIETDYLLDVVSQEMGPAFHPSAIEAGAIAARSFVMYHIYNGSSIDNSTNYQAFIPYKFESFNANDQQLIQNAVAPRYYLARSDGDLPALAMYFSDVVGATATSSEKPYLVGVDDPISTACNAYTDGTFHYGLSQNGAGRWARGNQCSYSGAGNQPWSVKWDNVWQILVHYYTGVHILDANNNNTILTPDNRWNLLWIQSLPPSLAKATSYDINLKFQNTSTWDWAPPNPGVLGYQWTTRGGQSAPGGWTTTSVVVSVLKGGAYQATVQVTTPSSPGSYDLHWDVARQEVSGSYTWFSGSWPHPVYPVEIGAGSTISQSSDDAGPNASIYSTCTRNFSTTDNEIYFGHCSDGTNVVSGFRFQNIQVPANATIVEAHLDFTVDGPYSNELAVTLYGERSVNSATFSKTKPPADRSTTYTSVLWNISATDEWAVGQYRFSPDLTSLIQEIVNLPNWNSGNPITIIVKPADAGITHRRVVAWDRHYAQPARLVITYR